MTGLVSAVHRVDLSREICYESSLSRIQVSGSEDWVETCGVYCSVSMKVQSPALRSIIEGDEMGVVLSRRCVDPCRDSMNADGGGNDSGISISAVIELRC